MVSSAERRVFVIHEDDGRFTWSLHDGVDRVVVRSPGDFPTREDCVKAIEEFREAAAAAVIVPGTHAAPKRADV
jgi:uncharacterized protein YegP (UPF0339 family)